MKSLSTRRANGRAKEAPVKLPGVARKVLAVAKGAVTPKPARPLRGVGSELEPDVRELVHQADIQAERERDANLVEPKPRGWLMRRRSSWLG